MNVKRLFAAILITMMLMVIASSLQPEVARAQCGPNDPACPPAPGEKEKKKRPTETPMPTSTPTLIPGAALLPGLPVVGGDAGGATVGKPPTPNGPRGLTIGLIIVALIGLLFTGGVFLSRRRSALPYLERNGGTAPGGNENLTVVVHPGDTQNLTITNPDPFMKMDEAFVKLENATVTRPDLGGTDQIGGGTL